MAESLDAFNEGQRTVDLAAPVAVSNDTGAAGAADEAPVFNSPMPDWALAACVDWLAVGRDYAAGRGREIPAYLADISNRGGGRAASPASCSMANR